MRNKKELINRCNDITQGWEFHILEREVKKKKQEKWKKLTRGIRICLPIQVHV